MTKKIEQDIRELTQQVDFIHRHRHKIYGLVAICLLIAWLAVLTS